MRNRQQIAAALAAKDQEVRAAVAATLENPDHKPKLAQLDAELSALKTEDELRGRLDAYERAAEGKPVDGESRERSHIASRYQFGEALDDHLAGRELRGAAGEWNKSTVSRRSGGFSVPIETLGLGTEARALTSTTPSGGPGSNLIATSNGPMIDRLKPSLMIQQIGATVIAGLTDNLDLPRHKASGTASWVAEHVNATRSDAQFDKISLRNKTVTAEYEISRKMVLQTTQLDGLLRADLAFLLNQALDLAAIAGTGTDQPTGILNTAGIFTHAGATNGKALDLDLAPDLIGALDQANAVGPRGFLTSAKVRKAAMKLRDEQGQPFGVPAVFGNEPVGFTNQVPSTLTKGSGTGLSAMIYAAWADLILAFWSSVDIVANPYHADVASKGGVLLHAFLDADVAVRHPESFAVSKDVIAP